MNSTSPNPKDQTRLAVLIADLLIASGTLVSAYDSVRRIDMLEAVIPVAFGSLMYLAMIARRAIVTRLMPWARAGKVAVIGMIAADNAWAFGESYIGRDKIRRAAVKRYAECKAAAGDQQPIFRHVTLKIGTLFVLVVVVIAVLQ